MFHVPWKCLLFGWFLLLDRLSVSYGFVWILPLFLEFLLFMCPDIISPFVEVVYPYVHGVFWGVKVKGKVAQSCPILWDPMDLYRPWNSPGQNTGVGSHFLLQGIFLTQGSNLGLPHCMWILYQLSHKGIPRILEWVAYPFSRGSSWSRNRTGISCIAGEFLTNWAIQESPVWVVNWLLFMSIFPLLSLTLCWCYVFWTTSQFWGH